MPLINPLAPTGNRKHRDPQRGWVMEWASFDKAKGAELERQIGIFPFSLEGEFPCRGCQVVSAMKPRKDSEVRHFRAGGSQLSWSFVEMWKLTAEKRNLFLSHSWRSQDSWPLYYITRLKCAAGITVKHRASRYWSTKLTALHIYLILTATLGGRYFYPKTEAQSGWVICPESQS